nr:MAG TPA: hypothetical protein [Caudoviricetes sp.]
MAFRVALLEAVTRSELYHKCQCLRRLLNINVKRNNLL